MCGRYTIHSSVEQIAEEFNVKIEKKKEFIKRFNAAPAQLLPVITNNKDTKEICFFSWGLIPSWVKDRKTTSKLINARSETVAEKPSFRNAFSKRRCIVPVNGFFEWQKTPSGKKPVYIYGKNNSLFAFAGLWEKWQNGDDFIDTFTVITTEPNKMVAPIHNRMPAILVTKKQRGAWLNRESNTAECLEVLRPCPEEEMKYFYVSTKVNNIENDFPQLIEPIVDESQSLLF